jgi:hypothetical protein
MNRFDLDCIDDPKQIFLKEIIRDTYEQFSDDDPNQ